MQMFNSGEEPELPVTSGKWSLFFLCLICGALVSSLRRSKKPSRAVNLTHGLEPEVVVQHLSLSWAAESPTPLCWSTGEAPARLSLPWTGVTGKGTGTRLGKSNIAIYWIPAARESHKSSDPLGSLGFTRHQPDLLNSKAFPRGSGRTWISCFQLG